MTPTADRHHEMRPHYEAMGHIATIMVLLPHIVLADDERLRIAGGLETIARKFYGAGGVMLAPNVAEDRVLQVVAFVFGREDGDWRAWVRSWR